MQQLMLLQDGELLPFPSMALGERWKNLKTQTLPFRAISTTETAGKQNPALQQHGADVLCLCLG